MHLHKHSRGVLAGFEEHQHILHCWEAAFGVGSMAYQIFSLSAYIIVVYTCKPCNERSRLSNTLGFSDRDLLGLGTKQIMGFEFG